MNTKSKSMPNNLKYHSNLQRSTLLGYRDPAPSLNEGIYKKLYLYPGYPYYPTTYSDPKPSNFDSFAVNNQRPYNQTAGTAFSDNSLPQMPQSRYPDSTYSNDNNRGQSFLPNISPNPRFQEGNQMSYPQNNSWQAPPSRSLSQNSSNHLPSIRPNYQQMPKDQIVSPTFSSFNSRTVLPRWPAYPDNNQMRTINFSNGGYQPPVNNNQYPRPQDNNYNFANPASRNFENQQGSSFLPQNNMRGYSEPERPTQLLQPKPVEQPNTGAKTSSNVQQAPNPDSLNQNNNSRTPPIQQNGVNYQGEMALERRGYNNNPKENVTAGQDSKPQNSSSSPNLQKDALSETRRQEGNTTTNSLLKFDPFKREDKLYGQHASTYPVNIEYPW